MAFNVEQAKGIMEVVRGAVRPYVNYLFASIFAAITIIAFLKYGNEAIAIAIITGFIGVFGTLAGQWAGGRQKPPEPPKEIGG